MINAALDPDLGPGDVDLNTSAAPHRRHRIRFR